jgi:large subunit ribosomal protein L17
MRHRKSRNLLNRRTTWRAATIKSLVQSLLVHESIKTTLNRAKATQPLVEKLISWGKANTLEKKRLAFAAVGDHKLVQLLFTEISPRFKARTGGYTRILRLENRRGDDAQMVLFQLTQLKQKTKAEKSRKQPKDIGKAEEVPAQPHEEKHLKDQPHAPEKESKPESHTPKKTAKPAKKFLGGIRNIFKKERDSL